MSSSYEYSTPQYESRSSYPSEPYESSSTQPPESSTTPSSSSRLFPHGKYGKNVGRSQPSSSSSVWNRAAGNVKEGTGAVFSEPMRERGISQKETGREQAYESRPGYGQGYGGVESNDEGYQRQYRYGSGQPGESYYGERQGTSGYGSQSGSGYQGRQGVGGYGGQTHQHEISGERYGDPSSTSTGSYSRSKPSSYHAGWEKFVGGLESGIGKLTGSSSMKTKGAEKQLAGAIEAEAARGVKETYSKPSYAF